MPVKGVIYNIQRMSVEDGPGIRTTVFFKGCPLRCLWCSNPESQGFAPQLMMFEDLCGGCGACKAVCPHDAVTVEGERRNRDLGKCVDCGVCTAVCPNDARVMSGREYDVDEVMRIVRRDGAFYRNSDGGVTFGGGECTSQGEFLLALLEASRYDGLHTCVDTCGCCSSDLLARVIPMTDLFLYDLKHMDPEAHKRLTGVDNTGILANLRTLLEADGGKVRIRMPLMPNLNDGDENIAAMSDFLRRFGCDNVDVMPCHFFGRSKYLALRRLTPNIQKYGPEELRAVLERFSRHGLKVTLI